MILLVRHGETEWNRARRIQGWGDLPLTARGIRQAHAIGLHLAQMPEVRDAAVVASPLGRARRTAEVIQSARQNNAVISFDDRLKEISLGAWEGLDRVEIDAHSPGIVERFGQDWYFQAPGGETYDMFAERIGAWLAEQGPGTVIAVAHGGVTRILRGLYAGLSRQAAMELPVPQDVIWRLEGGRIEEITCRGEPKYG